MLRWIKRRLKRWLLIKKLEFLYRRDERRMKRQQRLTRYLKRIRERIGSV
jgi:hypothetical protein